MASIYLESADIDIRTVTESYKQTGRETLWEKLPRLRVKDAKSGVADTTYRIPGIEDSLLNNSLLRVGFDQEPPREGDLTEHTVTVSPKYLQTLPQRRPINADAPQRVRDLEEIVPIAFDKLHQGLDRLVVAEMTNSSKFSSSTFDGTGALDTYASDHNPAKDVNDDLRSLRVWQGLTGLSLEAFMDEEVAAVLSGFEDYKMSYYADSGRQFMSLDAFAEAFRMTHRLDAVHIIRGAYNSAKQGATTSAARIASGLLWIGFADRRQGEWDLRERALSGPGGGIAMALGTELHAYPWIPAGVEVELINGRCSANVLSPQYDGDATNQLGIFYPSAQIFT